MKKKNLISLSIAFAFLALSSIAVRRAFALSFFPSTPCGLQECLAWF
jgi:hypothetical protein